MPVVRLYYGDLEEMVGASRETIMSRLAMMGADIGKRTEEDHVDVEFFPDRPDLYSSEGVARALQGFLGIKTGLPQYKVHPGDLTLEIDPSVMDIRPVIGCAVVKGLSFSDPAIESLMDLQEDLHWGLGRNRRKVAIGVHDLSRVKPPFRYLGEDSERRFVPLGFSLEMSMREILVRHPKGVEYAHILQGFSRYPLIVDALDRVLSFPPIINGQLTSVDEGTEDLFIDVTGTDPVVHKALNIVVTALAERGGRIESVVMKGEHGQFVSPNLTEECWTIDPNEANSLIGFRLSPAKMAECLERMRFGASPSSDGLKVKVPPYRADIMHPWDIFEDIAKGYGYDNLLAEMPGTATFGMPHPSQIKRAEIRDIMIGLGYLETMPFTLTSEKVHFQMMRRDPVGHTRVRHPISEEHTMIRTTLMPSLLEILALNKHHPLPQRIFAVGDVVKDGKNWGHLAAASIHSTAGFAEIRSVTEAVLRELDSRAEMISSEDGAFMPGRAADILVGSLTAGSFGEVHPLVLRGFGLDQPVVAMELEWHET